MFKKTLKNWLLKLGIASFALLILLQMVFAALGIDYPPISRDMLGENLSFGLFVILGVIVAPLFEEVAFRGFFYSPTLVKNHFFYCVADLYRLVV